MTTNKYVYPHPINLYIISYLDMPVDLFCSTYGFIQSTVATWVSRDRKVETLPASFLYALSLASSRDMSFVYEKLLDYQEIYLKELEQGKKSKKEIE